MSGGRVLIVSALVTVLAPACSSDGTQPQANPTAPNTESSPDASPEDETPDPLSDAVALTMVEYSFIPDELTIRSDQLLSITNKSPYLHSFWIEDQPPSVGDVHPSPNPTFVSPPFEPGTYTFYCGYHRYLDGMQGTLIVVDA